MPNKTRWLTRLTWTRTGAGPYEGEHEDYRILVQPPRPADDLRDFLSLEYAGLSRPWVARAWSNAAERTLDSSPSLWIYVTGAAEFTCQSSGRGATARTYHHEPGRPLSAAPAWAQAAARRGRDVQWVSRNRFSYYVEGSSELHDADPATPLSQVIQRAMADHRRLAPAP